MGSLQIPGITRIECPRCGHEFGDYDVPVAWMGLLHLTARCHRCRIEHVFEVDVGTRETSVVAVRRSAIA